MRYLSLFSGIEAATVAWHNLGWEPVAFTEIEKFPCAVLEHYYPDVPNESAVMQRGLTDSPVVIAQVAVPQDFKRLLPRLERKLACNIVLHRESGESPRPRAWRVTPDGLFLISHND